MSNADQIREFAYTRYVVPARKRGDAEVTLRAGDIHRDLKLVSAMPAVCSALDSRKFAQLAGVSLIERRGPPRGANVYYHFDLSGSPSHTPVQQRSRKSAPPHVSQRPAINTPHPQPSRGQRASIIDPGSSLILVSCVKSKLSRPAPARELYVSSLFQKMRAYAENSGAPWFILSALHGLVAPDAEIAPYELTLNKMGVDKRRAWGDKVLASLLPHLNGVDRVVFLAGARYREFLIGPLERRGIAVEVPMEGLAFGKQLSWLSGGA